MGDTMREAFEAFHGRRKSKGAVYRAALFARLSDNTYVDPSVQRHWWTWQNAVEAGRQLGMEQEHALWLMANDAAERHHGTPTPPAGDSDTQEN